MTDDEIVDVVEAHIGELEDQMSKALELLGEKMETMGIDSDAAFGITNIIALRALFFRKTILIALERSNEDDVMEWVENEYDAWEDEPWLAKNEQHEHSGG